MNIFEEIKSKLSLKDLVSKNVSLKYINGKYLGLCPFHLEKSPSFYVNNSKGVFYCFGCQAGGDLFDFYSKIHNCDKKECLKQLCSLLNIEIYKNKKNDSLEKLTNYFIMNLENNSNASKYLTERGINKNSIKKFKIGFMNSFKETVNFIKTNNLKLADYGFNENYFHMLENRIIFPVFNYKNEIITLSGRIFINSEKSKYINGPSSLTFNKSESLYGIFDYYSQIYLCEGYLDVIMFSQFGYNAFASMGTAFNDYHLQLVLNYSKKIILAFDGDEAGKKTTFKAASLCLKFITVYNTFKVILFEKGEDPASYLLKNNQLNLKEFELYEYFFYNLNFNLNLKEQISEVLKMFKLIPDYLIRKEFINNFLKLYYKYIQKNQNNNFKLNNINLPFISFCYYLKNNILNLENLNLNYFNEEEQKELINFKNNNNFSEKIITEIQNLSQNLIEKVKLLEYFKNLNLKKELSGELTEEIWEQIKKNKKF